MSKTISRAHWRGPIRDSLIWLLIFNVLLLRNSDLACHGLLIDLYGIEERHIRLRDNIRLQSMKVYPSVKTLTSLKLSSEW